MAWEWGAHDCGTALVRVFEAITGRHLSIAEGLSPRERSRLPAAELVGLAAEAAAAAGLEPTPNAKLLHRGDPCIVRKDGRTCLAFIGTRGYPTLAAGEGLEELDRKEIVAGWRIPA